MLIDDELVMKAFAIYSRLSAAGKCGAEDYRRYMSDDEIRNLIHNFAYVQECAVIAAGESLYLIPFAKNSIYHVSNEFIKTKYLPDKATNGDLYLMYAALIVLIGEFYDSDKSLEASRDFIRIEEWLDKLNDRLEALKAIGADKLKAYEIEYKYNWTTIIDKWDALNDISEKAKVQDARTKSRYAFLNSTKKFLLDMELLYEEGEELFLTEKTKVIVQKYFMEEEYNQGILDFIYSFKRKEGPGDAVHSKN